MNRLIDQESLDPHFHALRMPGATLTTRLRVYDTPSIDGKIGGTPHLHLLCTEMYFVTQGSGFVELIDMRGFSTVSLTQYTALVFSPGTIHRLVNSNRDLELFIIMQNSGLPERGDNVVPFPQEIMQDEEAFASAMRVQTVEDAYRRRDLGVAGFLHLKAAFEASLELGQQMLKRLYALAVERTQHAQPEWRELVTQGALAEAQASLKHLDALSRSETDYLEHARHFAIAPQHYSGIGFCGHLNRYFDPATLSLDGQIRTEP